MKNSIKIASLCVAATLALTPLANASILEKPATDALLMALEDEYLAEATYADILDKLGDIRPFSNIIRAERKHQAALKELFATYDINIPKNPYFEGTKSLAATPSSKKAACNAGIEAEIANLKLYDDILLPMVANNADIVEVFTNLKDASEFNHLPAFNRCAGR